MLVPLVYRSLGIWDVPLVYRSLGIWDGHLVSIEFACNNSFHSGTQMAPYEALYGWICRTPICWEEVGLRSQHGPELKEMTRKNTPII